MGTEIHTSKKIKTYVTLLKRENKKIKTLIGSQVMLIKNHKTSFCLRGGIGKEKLTIGAGISINNLIIDYAYELTEKETNKSSQLISLTWIF